MNGILVQAYSSLGAGELVKHPVVLDIARITPGLTPAQILLLWAIQRGIAVVPKASSRQRLDENIAVFRSFEEYHLVLNEDSMILLDSLDSNHHFCWNPENVA